jgi:hypothetical protein
MGRLLDIAKAALPEGNGRPTGEEKAEHRGPLCAATPTDQAAHVSREPPSCGSESRAESYDGRALDAVRPWARPPGSTPDWGAWLRGWQPPKSARTQ